MNKLAIFVALALILFLTSAAYSAALVSYGLPESKSMMFGSPDGSADNYYGIYVDSAGKLKISTIDSVTALTINVVDTVEVLETVEVVSSVTTVDTVTTVGTVSDITGGTIDTVSAITAGFLDIDYATDSFIGEVERGNISGVSLIEIASFNDTLNTTFELVSPSSTPEVGVMLTTAETVWISSSSATDDKDLTGALSLIISGSNTAGARISETLNLEGTASQETTASFYCIDNVRIGTVGSGGVAVGDLYVSEGGIGTVAGVPNSALAKIPIGYGASGNGKFMVPIGDTAVLVDLAVSCSGTGPYVLIGMVKTLGSAQPARMFCSVTLDDGEQTLKLNKLLNESDYIYFLAKSANAGDDISIHARVLLY